jgi:hypothetical protein
MQQKLLNGAPPLFLLIYFVGLLLTGMAIRRMYIASVFEKTGVTCLGVVDQIDTDSEALRFRVHFTYQQQAYDVYNQVMDNAPIYHLQQRVEVLFLPTQPQDAIINSEKEKYQGYGVMLLVGVFITAIGPAIHYIKWLKSP